MDEMKSIFDKIEELDNFLSMDEDQVDSIH